jgi:hypothetical protein
MGQIGKAILNLEELYLSGPTDSGCSTDSLEDGEQFWPQHVQFLSTVLNLDDRRCPNSE